MKNNFFFFLVLLYISAGAQKHENIQGKASSSSFSIDNHKRDSKFYNPFNPDNSNFEIKTIVSGLPYTGDGEDRLKAFFQTPNFLIFDDFENLYLTDSGANTIRMINKTNNLISTIGGNGIYGFTPDGNSAINSSLYYPNYLVIDEKRDLLYFIEFGSRIRSINLNSNFISTIGGNGIPGFTPDGNLAKNSSLNLPVNLIIDKKRDLLYFIEYYSFKIRSIDLNSNIISTIGGDGTLTAQIDGSFANQTGMNFPFGLALDSIGDFLYYSDSGNSIIRRIDFNNNNKVFTISGQNGNFGFFGENIDSSLALLTNPTNLFFSSIENSLYFMDFNRIRKISFGNNLNIISTFMGNGTNPNGNSIIKEGDFRLNISISNINSINQDSSKALFFTFSGSNKIFRIGSINGIISIYAGIDNLNQLNGYNAYFAQLNSPNSILIDKNNNHLLICDSYNNKIKKIKINNIPQIILDFVGTGNSTYNNDENIPSLLSNLKNPNSIVFDNFGNFYFSDYFNFRIRKIDNSTNNLISTIGGNGIYGFTPDGNSAINSSLYYPNYLVIDKKRDLLYFIELIGSRIRSINLNSNFILSTIGGNGIPGFTPDGNLAKNSSLNLPVNLIIDKKRDLLYFIESYYNSSINLNIYSIRSINLNSNILSTIGGNEINGFTPDDNLIKNSSFANLSSIALDFNGNIVFIESIIDQNQIQFTFYLRFINISNGILKTIFQKNISGISFTPSLSFDLNENLYVILPINQNSPALGQVFQFIFNPINNSQITTDFVLNQTTNQEIIPITSGNNKNNNSFLIFLLSVLLPILFVLLLIIGIIFVIVFISKKRKNKNTNSQKPLQLVNIELDEKKYQKNNFLSNIIIEQKIGSGQFGSVFKGKWNKSIFVALKTLTNEETMKDFFDEMNMLQKLQHPNIVQYFGIFQDVENNNQLFIVTEFMNKGNLLDLLQNDNNNNNSFFSSNQLLNFCKQACNGMIYLSNENIIHRDLAARNLLVHQENNNSSSFIIKIADFGLSRTLLNHYYITSSNMIPIKWSPPEVLEKRKYSIQSDIWSFGIVIWEIFSYGKKPYPDLNNLEVVEKVIFEGHRMKNPNENLCSNETYSLMLDCWKFEPNERPNFNEIYQRLN